MIGYKATDMNMVCRNQQYKLGSEYYITGDRKCIENFCLIPSKPVWNSGIGICTNKVIHYCDKLEDCFIHYCPDNSRFFKVEIKGEYYSKGNKSCTNRLKFLEEIPKEEIDKLLEEQRLEQEDKTIGLDKIRMLQEKFPNLILGGSIALFLQGAKLDRVEKGLSDFDLIHPFWVDLTEMDGIDYIDSKNSGNTFDETFNFNGVKLDLALDANCKYRIVEYNGHKYKVNTIENILKYKSQYATQKNGSKHKYDLYELLGVNIKY